MPLLAHTTNQTQERHYNRASIQKASRRLADAIAQIRQNLKESILEEAV